MATATKKKAAKKSGSSPSASRQTPKKRAGKASPKKKWSKKVNETSDALDLEEGVFTFKDPAKIARSLKRSAEKSSRKKGTPYQSAMSMLNFYINRGGKNLSKAEKKPLEEAKDELRKLFGRTEE